MVDKYVKALNQRQKTERNRKYWILGGVLSFVLLVVFLVVLGSAPQNSYLKEMRVDRANILEMAQENGKFYIRLGSGAAAIPSMSEESQWVEVTSDFYLRRSTGQEVGVLFGQYDVFRQHVFSKGQSFDKSIWGIEDVYETIQDAQAANPQKTMTIKAALKKKKTTKDGSMYFVVDAEGRSMQGKVNKELYDKYNLEQQVTCEIDAIGDFWKLARIVD